MSKVTTIRLHQDTKDKLAAIGHKNESYEDIVIRIMKEAKK